MKGRFITFEGGDGAGKTTLIEAIFDELEARGLKVLKTRAPGGTPVGEKIRAIVLNKGELSFGNRCELLLFLADRAQHVEEVILPALARGEIVLCDRFNDSTLVYQGIARGLGIDKVLPICLFASQNLKPNLTLYLDLDPRLALERLHKSSSGKDRIESEDLHFHEKIRSAFQKIAKAEPERVHLLDASRSPEEVYRQAMRLIDALCPQTAS